MRFGGHDSGGDRVTAAGTTATRRDDHEERKEGSFHGRDCKLGLDERAIRQLRPIYNLQLTIYVGFHAGVAELADAGDLKSPDPKGRVGSIPTPGKPDSAMNQVLLDNHRRFLAFVEKRVGDRALAEDILQDAFVRSIDKAGDVPDEALVPWFYTTLRNAVIDRYRRGASQSRALEAFGKELERARDTGADLDREICACVRSPM